MAKTPKLRLLRERQREVDDEIARAKAALAALETQASELKIAERVLASLSIDEDDDDTDAPGGAAPNGHDPADTARKPDGIPTMPEMIIQAISNAAAGGRGLEPKKMTEYIDKRWWPGVPGNAVSPIAWRMHKRKELAKRGSRYYLPAPVTQASEEAS